METRPAGSLDGLLQAGYRYAVTLCRDRVAAEDLVQEACLGVVRAGKDFEKSYLFAAIRNRYIDQYRRARLLVLEPYQERDDVDPGPDLEEVQANRDQLRRAFTELRDAEREALYLNVIEGYSAREIGDLTGRPRNTVLSLIHRGRNKLKELLRADEAGEEVAS